MKQPLPPPTKGQVEFSPPSDQCFYKHRALSPQMFTNKESRILCPLRAVKRGRDLSGRKCHNRLEKESKKRSRTRLRWSGELPPPCSALLMSKQSGTWEGKETQELSLKPLRAQPLSNFICTGARRSREATVAAARQKFSFLARARHSLDLTWSRGSGRAPQWSLY